MIVKYDENEKSIFELTKLETEELKQTGYMETDDGWCITYNRETKEIGVYRIFTDWEIVEFDKKC